MNTELESFSTRLASYGERVVVAAALLEDLLVGLGWTSAIKARSSKTFAPASRTSGEAGLRIHFESHAHQPALEFALKEVSMRNDDSALHHLRAALEELDPRTRNARDFPSVPLTVLLSRWETGGRAAVLAFAAVRSQ